jgi:integral membrane protein (TIGR01906 family)
VRLVGRLCVGVVLTAFLLGASVQLLLAPAYTRTLASRVSLAEQAGISRSSAVSLAEDVRSFVAAPSVTATLPAIVDGRAGFDAGAVSHLRDVAGVLAGARLATVLAGTLLVLWLAALMLRHQMPYAASALRWGAGFSAGVVLLAVVIAMTSFDEFFMVFHALFFAPGTWTFPYDSLLIQLFPEPFWAITGGAWAALVLLGSGGLWLAAARLDAGRGSVTADKAGQSKA